MEEVDYKKWIVVVVIAVEVERIVLAEDNRGCRCNYSLAARIDCQSKFVFFHFMRKCAAESSFTAVEEREYAHIAHIIVHTVVIVVAHRKKKINKSRFLGKVGWKVWMAGRRWNRLAEWRDEP